MGALLQAVNSELTETTLSPSTSFASMASEEFDRTHAHPVLTDAETLFRRLQGGRGLLVLTRMRKNWTCVEVALGVVESTEFTKLRRNLVGPSLLEATRSHVRGGRASMEKISKFTTRKPSARFSWSPHETPTTTAGTESSGRDPRIRD